MAGSWWCSLLCLVGGGGGGVAVGLTPEGMSIGELAPEGLTHPSKFRRKSRGIATT